MKAALILSAFLTVATAATAFADDEWVVARKTSSGSCSLQLATSRPIDGVELGSADGPKATCELARSLKTDDITETSKCWTYTPNTIAFCAKRGVTLQE